jgi:hypothetical protein
MLTTGISKDKRNRSGPLPEITTQELLRPHHCYHSYFSSPLLSRPATPQQYRSPSHTMEAALFPDDTEGPVTPLSPTAHRGPPPLSIASWETLEDNVYGPDGWRLFGAPPLPGPTPQPQWCATTYLPTYAYAAPSEHASRRRNQHRARAQGHGPAHTEPEASAPLRAPSLTRTCPWCGLLPNNTSRLHNVLAYPLRSRIRITRARAR